MSKLKKLIYNCFFCSIMMLAVASAESHKFIKDSITILLAEKLGVEPDQVKIKLDNIPSKHQDLTDIKITYVNLNKFRANLTYTNSIKEYLAGMYSLQDHVIVTTRYLPKKHIIKSEDIQKISIPIKNPQTISKKQYVREEEEILNLQIVKDLPKGTPIKLSEVENPVLVLARENVFLVYNKGNIKISTNAIALGSGKIGDVIKVRNNDTGAIMSGVIVAKGTIRISTSNIKD